MTLELRLNGRQIAGEVAPDAMLIDFLRANGCMSVKRGCDTANCGLCTVLLDGKPILSCSYPALRAHGHAVVTLEGLQAEAEEFGGFMADEGADQCGFCNPGFIMNVLAMVKELPDPTEAQIRAYLSGNLCRCSGFVSQHRAIARYIRFKRENER